MCSGRAARAAAGCRAGRSARPRGSSPPATSGRGARARRRSRAHNCKSALLVLGRDDQHGRPAWWTTPLETLPSTDLTPASEIQRRETGLINVCARVMRVPTYPESLHRELVLTAWTGQVATDDDPSSSRGSSDEGSTVEPHRRRYGGESWISLCAAAPSA